LNQNRWIGRMPDMSQNKKAMALETSGKRGSVAIGCDFQVIAEKEFTAVNRNAAELLPVMSALCAEAGWKPAEVEDLYISIGPGSFTGLRIAVTVAKTMAYAGNIKVVAVPAMEALAMNAAQAEIDLGIEVTNLAILLEAKRNQVYCAGFRRDRSVAPETILDPNIASKGIRFTPELHRNDPEMHRNTPVLPGFEPVLPTSILEVPDMLDRMGKPLRILGEGLQFYSGQCQAEGVERLPEPYWGGRARCVYLCGRRLAEAGRFANVDSLEPMYLRRPEAEERWEKRGKS